MPIPDLLLWNVNKLNSRNEFHYNTVLTTPGVIPHVQRMCLAEKHERSTGCYNCIFLSFCNLIGAAIYLQRGQVRYRH